MKQNEDPECSRWETGNVTFTVPPCPVFSPDLFQDRGQEGSCRGKAAKIALAVTETSSWSYVSHLMAISPSLICSNKKSSAFTHLVNESLTQ